MKKILAMLAIPFLAMAFISCEDDADNPTDGGDGGGGSSDLTAYMPLAVGNYWVFETTYYDENGNEYTGTDEDLVKSFDTLKITAKETFMGKEAYKFEDTQNDDDDDESYFAYENGKLLFWFGMDLDDTNESEEPEEEMDFDFDFESKWVTMLGDDGYSETILAFDTIITQTEDEFTFTIEMDWNISVNTKDNGSYTYENTTDDSKKATIIGSFTQTLPIVGPQTENTESSSIFLKGVGMVEAELDDAEDDNGNEYIAKQYLVEYKLN